MKAARATSGLPEIQAEFKVIRFLWPFVTDWRKAKSSWLQTSAPDTGPDDFWASRVEVLRDFDKKHPDCHRKTGMGPGPRLPLPSDARLNAMAAPTKPVVKPSPLPPSPTQGQLPPAPKPNADPVPLPPSRTQGQLPPAPKPNADPIPLPPSPTQGRSVDRPQRRISSPLSSPSPEQTAPAKATKSRKPAPSGLAGNSKKVPGADAVPRLDKGKQKMVEVEKGEVSQIFFQ
jgi:hypothetical protein